MKTYTSVSSFENALRLGDLHIEQVVGQHNLFFYFLGLVEGTDDRIIRIKVG